MAAYSKVTDQEIYDALVQTGGAVAAAAHLLNVSPRTLQRRVKANPDIKLYPCQDPSFDLAWQRVCDAQAKAEGARWFGTSAVLAKKFAQEVEWHEGDVELEPQHLEGHLLREFLDKLRSAEPMMATVKESVQNAARKRSRSRQL